MSQHINEKSRYPLNLPSFPDFNTNPNSTEEEQIAAFSNVHKSTGIQDHGYTGVDSGVGNPDNIDIPVGNYGTLVIAPNQSNSGSESQALQLVTGQNVLVSRKDGVISGGNELVPGGLGMSPNILLNIPSSDGTYRGRPVWNYSSMEIIYALPIYQANRARMLDRMGDIVESGEYDFFVVALPANFADCLIAWKDTYRTQLRVPAESLLVMILGSYPGSIPVPPG